ncbi:Pin4 protein [Saccharomycopsis crataegensis]|uniref:Pin4 protein n=1 Tax=Saccharomycopsis crataegensis TaxID=43959 RepID=A0AAV5QPB1_9ASCO|nr:Pin4 protein [Saccharomycopsis crataegensis]
MDLRSFTPTPLNLEEANNAVTPRGNAFNGINNGNTGRMMPPRSPAMSTTSTSSYSAYSTSQYNMANTPTSSSVFPGNVNNPSSSVVTRGQGINQNAQRMFQNQNSGFKGNVLSPSLPVGINPLNVNNWIDQQAKNVNVPSRSGTPANDDKNGVGIPGATMSAIASSNHPSVTSLTGIGKKEDLEEEVIPTAIVIKNIPFSIKKEQLLEEMTKLSLPLPYAFNYHFDNGVFRGLAFANFTSTEETAMVVNNLNSKEIGGRKLRVEYKKMLPLIERERIEREKREKRGQLEEQHRSASTTSLASLISNGKLPANQGLNGVGVGCNGVEFEKRYFAGPPNIAGLPVPPQVVDFNNPEVLDIYSTLLLFKSDVYRKYEDVAYPLGMPNNHKKYLNILCNFLNLSESYENGFIIIKRKFNPAITSPNMTNSPIANSQPVIGANGGPFMHSNLNVSHSNLGLLNVNQRFRGQPTTSATHQPQPRAPGGQSFGLLNNTSPNNIGGNSPNITLGANSTGSQTLNSPITSGSNNNPAAMLRGTRSYADVRNTPFALPSLYGHNNNNNGNSNGNQPSLNSPTYLNMSQPPTPGIGGASSEFTNSGSNANKSPYVHSNNSATFLNQNQPGVNQTSQAQSLLNLGNSGGNSGSSYFANNSSNSGQTVAGGASANESTSGFNPPSHSIYSHFNNSNPNFLSNNNSMLNLTQNLTGGDTFTTTLSPGFNNFDDLGGNLNNLASPIGIGSNSGVGSTGNTPTATTIPSSSLGTSAGGLKSSTTSIASNSPNINNNVSVNGSSTVGKNLISSLNDGLNGLNLSSNSNNRRDIWGSGRSTLI